MLKFRLVSQLIAANLLTRIPPFLHKIEQQQTWQLHMYIIRKCLSVTCSTSPSEELGLLVMASSSTRGWTRLSDWRGSTGGEDMFSSASSSTSNGKDKNVWYVKKKKNKTKTCYYRLPSHHLIEKIKMFSLYI